MLPGPKRRVSPSLVVHSISPASVTQNQCFGIGCQVASHPAAMRSRVAALVAMGGPDSVAGLPGTTCATSSGTPMSSKCDSPSGVATTRGYFIKRDSWNRLLRGTSGTRVLVRHWAREPTSCEQGRTGKYDTGTDSAAAGFRGDGRAPYAGGGPVSTGRDSGRDRASIGREPSSGLGVAQGVAARRPSCVARGGTCRAAPQTEPGATGQSEKDAAARSRGQRLSGRCVDVAARGRGDRAVDGRGVPPRPCLVHLARPIALELAAAGSAGAGA